MERLLLAAVLVVIAVVIAFLLQRRKPAPPTAAEWNIPIQLDRQDFLRPDAQWLVAVFTSSTCDACSGVWSKAVHLDAGPDGPVCVQELEAVAEADIHRRYGIDAVPLVLIADGDGIVRQHFVGPVTATDLWAAVAEVREPGSTPGPCDHHTD